MKDTIKELVAIFMAVLWACVGAENSDTAGADKKQAVVDEVLKELTTPEGLYVAPGFLYDAIKMGLPFAVNAAVKLLNSFGVFKQSS